MTDRELLEMAAKAADIPHGADRIDCGLSLTNADGRHTSLPRWNPLEDDGDALRLAVRCGVLVSQQCSYVSTHIPHGGVAVRGVQWNEYYGNDPYAATRRAIVRAAAAIGQEMP